MLAVLCAALFWTEFAMGAAETAPVVRASDSVKSTALVLREVFMGLLL
jgi:hypothetical protein